MEKRNLKIVPAGATATTLRHENEELSRQLKRLVRAEAKLYEYQQELDAQLKEFKGLYELSRTLGGSFNIATIIDHTLGYAVNSLEFERAVFLLRQQEGDGYQVAAVEGYFEPAQREQVLSLRLAPTDPVLAPLIVGKEYLSCHGAWCSTGLDALEPVTAPQEVPEPTALTDLGAALFLEEYFLYPLARRPFPYALLAVGNSSSNASFYRRVDDRTETLISMGNLVGLISPLIENRIFYQKLQQALEQERMTEAKYRNIFENAVEGLFRRTAAGQFMEANPALARMLGYTSVEELISDAEASHFFVNPQRREEFLAALEEQGTVEGFEAEVQHRDGRTIWVSISARMVRGTAGGTLFYEGMVEEISARKQAEAALKESEQRYRQLSQDLERRVKETVDELRQKDKLLILQSRQAIMGEMLNNIAHQWRQPLNILALLIQELQMTQKVTGLTQEYVATTVEKSLDILMQMSGTIDDFRYFFRPATERVQFRVAESVEKTLSMLEGSFKIHGIQTRFTQEGDPVVNGYPSEFIQVLLNIMINARDALVADEVPSPEIEIHLTQQGEVTVLTIADNAGGVPEAIIEKIFDPYFTTKGPDKGTGIGLYMCKTIVEKNMNGSLAVRNRGNGAEFRIEIR